MRFVLSALVCTAFLTSAPDYPRAKERHMLVEEHIEKRGVRNPEVLRVMRAVPRHEFVPQQYRDDAYDDRPLSIGHGATISQPYIVAAMTELLDPARHHEVLEIGTGSGYQAAVLSMLVKDVYSIEIVPELAARSAEALKRLGYANVHVQSWRRLQGLARARAVRPHHPHRRPARSPARSDGPTEERRQAGSPGGGRSESGAVGD